MLAAMGGWLLVGSHAHASNGNKPRVPPVFLGETCLWEIDRSQSPSATVDYRPLYEDGVRGEHELEDSRTFQFFALCRPLSVAEQLPLWITVDDAMRALDSGAIDHLPEDDAIAEKSDVWRFNANDESQCMFAINPAERRLPITCSDAAQGVHWDTSNLPAGNYVVYGYTFEPPVGLWVPRGGVVRVHDGAPEQTQPGAALVEALPLDGDAANGYVLRGCVSHAGATAELEWIDGASAQVSDEDAWTVFASVTVSGQELDFELPFRTPPQAAGRGVFVRVVGLAKGQPSWRAPAPRPLVLTTGADGFSTWPDTSTNVCLTSPAGGSGSSDGSETSTGAASVERAGCGCSRRKTSENPLLSSVAWALILMWGLRMPFQPGRPRGSRL